MRWALFAVLPFFAAAPLNTGTTTGPPPFTAEMKVAKDRVSVDDTLELKLALQFPEGYTVRVGELKHHLLKYGGLGEPPFTIQNEKMETLDKGVDLLLTLTPQVPGTYALTFQDIHFYPKEGDAPAATLISEIVPIEVVLPPAPIPAPIPPPLVPLEPRYPIEISLENRTVLLKSGDLILSEEQRNRTVIASRTIPWGHLAVTVLLGLFYFISFRKS